MAAKQATHGWVAILLLVGVALVPARVGAAVGEGSALPLPLVKLAVVAMPNGGAAQRVELPCGAGTPASGSGVLGSTYRVEWAREGAALRVKAARQDEGKYWRLALEARFAAGARTLSVGYHALPVHIPMARVAKTGQFCWFWTEGLPGWLVAERDGRAAGILPETLTHHGFFLIREADGSVAAQLCLDAWKPGETAEIAFRVLDEGAARRVLAQAAKPLAQPRPAPAAGSTPCKGFIRVDRSGQGLTDAAKRPWVAMGRNQSDLPTRTPEEQERFLRRMAEQRMNTVRFLLTDYCYRPVPGVWNEDALRRLRATLDRCAAHGIRAVVCLEYSACAYQYHGSMHRSPAWSDLYLLDEMTRWYADLVERVVKPLRDHPGVFAWDVTNEPMVEPDGSSLVQRDRFREWLRGCYGTVEKLRAGWGLPDAGFETAELPDMKSFEEQSTPAARDFFRWSNDALAEGLIARARLVRAADPNHLITLSHGQPRQLRGHAGAEAFDFWSPHTYDLWINGPEIERHALFLKATLENALGDRRRPVVIEEFGIQQGPRYPEEMRAQHVREFRQAVRSWGLAGLLHWWEMAPVVEAAYADPLSPPSPQSRGESVAVYLPPGQEWKLMVYAQYMARRQWAGAVTRLAARGCDIRFVAGAPEARGCGHVLVLADALAADEAEVVRQTNLPVWVLPGAKAVRDALPGAEELP